MQGVTSADIERFMSYVEKLPNGCWYWTGARSRGKGNKKWYGSFWVDGKSVRAHRFSCTVLAHKDCPPGFHRDHTCSFSMCVAPHHFEIITHEENEIRKKERRIMEAKHILKSWTGLFEPIYQGYKQHELRVLDRDYQVGDILELQEFEPITKEYTGRKAWVEITYITSSIHGECAFSPMALHKATGILSIKLLKRDPE